MTLQQIKSEIENKTLANPSVVFVTKDYDNFILKQYIKAISELFNLEPETVEVLPRKSVVKTVSHKLIVYYTDTYVGDAPENTIVVTKKCDTGINIVKLEDWMISDYAKSTCRGVDDIEWLCKRYKYDINRIDIELEKLRIFPEDTRQTIFNLMRAENNFDDVETSNALDLCDAVENSNSEKLMSILENKTTSDVTLFFVLTVFHNKFSQLLKVKTLRQPTLENTGCSTDKQLNWMKYHVNSFTGKQLLEMFCTISEVDYKMRGEGVLTEDQAFDYFITQIIQMRDKKR